MSGRCPVFVAILQWLNTFWPRTNWERVRHSFGRDAAVRYHKQILDFLKRVKFCFGWSWEWWVCGYKWSESSRTFPHHSMLAVIWVQCNLKGKLRTKERCKNYSQTANSNRKLSVCGGSSNVSAVFAGTNRLVATRIRFTLHHSLVCECLAFL
jgi:hypothetical protein